MHLGHFHEHGRFPRRGYASCRGLREESDRGQTRAHKEDAATNDQGLFLVQIILSVSTVFVLSDGFPAGLESARERAIQGDPELQQDELRGNQLPSKPLFVRERREDVKIVADAV